MSGINNVCYRLLRVDLVRDSSTGRRDSAFLIRGIGRDILCRVGIVEEIPTTGPCLLFMARGL